MALHLLGIRHHGPGSAAHVLAALERIKPDIILVEGPPEADEVLHWMNHEEMKPPVALLAYVPDDPQQSSFYPFTYYSPEWNAIRFGLQNKIPVRFMDMPLMHYLATRQNKKEPEDEKPSTTVKEISKEIYKNPIAYLAEIDGYEDAEEWWEQKFELASHPEDVFEAIHTAMASLRTAFPHEKDTREPIREAFMRKAIRLAEKEMYSEIVVVCGAWHVPALANMPAQKEDDAIIKGLPKTKIETTWIPWTNDRLSFESGYGAGVQSPGWYGHHWQNPDDDGAKWLTHTARVFRNNKMDISSAHIIESVRLSNALSNLRQRARPGLKEFNEATQSVMCMGDDVLMRLVWQELIVGRDMGSVPEGAPQVPLQRDLEQTVKSLRLKFSNDPKLITIDLRENNDLQKSMLLHRLLLLNIDWGDLKHSAGKGTFKEQWELRWYPELTIKLLEKAPWGNSVASAANNYLQAEAKKATGLDEVTRLVQMAIPAELHQGIAVVMQQMDTLAAGTSDTAVLMNAFIPLVTVSRYGNVRKTDLETIRFIMETVFYRMVAHLPLSVTGIDEEQGVQLSEQVTKVNQCVLLLEDEVLKAAWLETIYKIPGIQQAAATVQGCCCKILYDTQYISKEDAALIFSRALSINNDPAYTASWLEGFLKDAATVLILDNDIWNIINQWVQALEETTFLEIVPLLRRAFSNYSNPEKTKIAARSTENTGTFNKTMPGSGLDEARAQKIIPVLEQLMGL